MTTLTSRNGELNFGPDFPVVLINAQLQVLYRSSKVIDALKLGKIERLLKMARFGAEVGTDMVDILLTHPELDEVALLPKVAVAVHEELGCPISLDSRNPQALAAALDALKPYKALLNSVTAEKHALVTLLPIAAEYGAAVVGMPIGDIYGMPKTVEGRMAEAQVIIDAAATYGIPKEDIVMDAICLAASVEPGSMLVTLETLRRFHEELGVATTLGVGNAGHGMPERTQIELAYLLAAIPWGLDSALVNSKTPLLIEETRAMDFLSGRDPYGLRYIKHYRNKK
ncbi:MAG: dihydropteroate synthase [Anaerolineae bacterium]|nr:dihydropteroate synthase [Anaerolineae bacterium]